MMLIFAIGVSAREHWTPEFVCTQNVYLDWIALGSLRVEWVSERTGLWWICRVCELLINCRVMKSESGGTLLLLARKLHYLYVWKCEHIFIRLVRCAENTSHTHKHTQMGRGTFCTFSTNTLCMCADKCCSAGFFPTLWAKQNKRKI